MNLRTTDPGRTRIILAFIAVYIIWGSTYLAIRFAVETLPPFLMATARFAVAGAIMFAWCRWRGAPTTTRRHWRDAWIIGTLMLLGGNGLVSWAEQWVPSGLAALLVATVPLWMGLMNWVIEPAARPRARGIAGIIVGFLGVAFLVNPRGEMGADPQLLLGAFGVILACVLWAAGSLYSRRAAAPGNAFLSTAMQMLMGSVSLAVVATFTGEWGRIDPATMSTKSILAVVYLVLFGSMIALSAYVWLLKATEPAKVSTYAYVNPVVAVFLGWLFAGETLSTRTLLAAAIIVGSVVMITSEKKRAATTAGPGTTSPITKTISKETETRRDVAG